MKYSLQCTNPNCRHITKRQDAWFVKRLGLQADKVTQEALQQSAQRFKCSKCRHKGAKIWASDDRPTRVSIKKYLRSEQDAKRPPKRKAAAPRSMESVYVEPRTKATHSNPPKEPQPTRTQVVAPQAESMDPEPRTQPTSKKSGRPSTTESPWPTLESAKTRKAEQDRGLYSPKRDKGEDWLSREDQKKIRRRQYGDLKKRQRE